MIETPHCSNHVHSYIRSYGYLIVVTINVVPTYFSSAVIFSLLVPESICEGSEGSICIQLGTELEREALAEVMIFDSQKSKCLSFK